MDFHADRELWDAAVEMAFPHDEDISYWGFSRPDGASKTFQLTVWRNGKRQSAFVGREHAPMLVSFDISHWTAYTDSHLAFDQNIIRSFCFLHKLRQIVEKEILGARPGCATLLFWAVRTIRGKNHFTADAAELQREAAYSHLPHHKGKRRFVIPRWHLFLCSTEWATHLVTNLRWITKDVEIHLQESASEARTGHPDSFSYSLNELGLWNAIKRLDIPLPFKPAKAMPDLVTLGRKRGLTATAITNMSKRARNDILQGTELGALHLPWR